MIVAGMRVTIAVLIVTIAVLVVTVIAVFVIAVSFVVVGVVFDHPDEILSSDGDVEPSFQRLGMG